MPDRDADQRKVASASSHSTYDAILSKVVSNGWWLILLVFIAWRGPWLARQPGEIREHRAKVQAEEAARAAARARGEGIITIENAPNNWLRGSLTRKLKSGWDGPGRIKRVITLHPNDFDVVFADAYGDDWVYRFQAGKGEWTTPSEKGEILSLEMNGSRAKWSGRLYDKAHGDEPIYFEMKFWVEGGPQ